MKLKASIIISVLLLSSLFVVLLNVKTASAETSIPTIWVTIYRIQKVDPIEGFLEDGADWRYKIYVWNGESWNTQEHKPASNNDNIIVNKIHKFENIETTTTTIYIDLFEDDFFGYEIADISSQKGVARFYLTYNLKDNTIGGDEVIVEGAYYKTSGDYDGSVAVDENDANLWFYISDNYALPQAEASASDQTPDTYEKVNFDASDSTASLGSTIVRYQWDFENDGIYDAEGETASYTYTEAGEYYVILKVTDNLGESDTDLVLMNVQNQPPEASFSYSPSEPTILDAISFFDTSEDKDGTIVSWSWNFGDGNTSTQRDPSHQYADKGNYTVQLNVTDNDGEKGSITHTVAVRNLDPIANFTYAPQSPKEGDNIQFTDASTDPEGKQLSWLWDFGDGYTSEQKNPVHGYTDPGEYDITLTVTDDEGATDHVTKRIVIAQNLPPIVDFEYSPTIPQVNELVNFTDLSSDPESKGFTSWTWDFGDGNTSTLQNPTHEYVMAGEYVVNLTVTDDVGATDSTQKIINVNSRPIASFSYSPAEPTIQDGVHFADASEDSDGTIVSWMWNFGDEKTSTLQNPTHQYSDKGSYTITLTVTDNDEAQNSVTKTITIYNIAPTASFTFSPNTPMANEDVQFTDGSTDPEDKPMSCLWDFGDGNTSTKENPVHEYQSEGTYNVTLAVTDDEGLTSTLSKTISIKGRPISLLPWFVLGGVAVGAVILVAAIIILRRRK